jgi:hypothetical protein
MLTKNTSAKKGFVRTWLAACLFCLSLSGYAQEEVVQEFMNFYFHSYQSGTPDAGQIDVLSHIVTPGLHKLLLDAHDAETCHARRVHGTEPPLLEGDLFTSLFEGATAGKIAAVRVDGNTAEIDVEWTYAAEGEQPTVWRDRFYLVSGKGAWLIEDIEHRGEWEFSYHGRISDLLRDIAGQCGDGVAE